MNVPSSDKSAGNGAFDRYTETAALRAGNAADAYAWSARYYDAHVRPLLPVDRGARILELGCGFGRFLKYVHARGYAQAEGVDLSQQQVETAQREGVRNAHAGDAEVFLERAHPGYAAVFAFDLLEHVDTGALLRIGALVRQRLAPGGTFVVQVPNALAPLAPIRHADLTHVRAFTKASLEQFFLMSGFTADALEVRELPPHIHGPASAVRRALWSSVLRPGVRAFMLVAYGDAMGGLYTANILGIARAA